MRVAKCKSCGLSELRYVQFAAWELQGVTVRVLKLVMFPFTVTEVGMMHNSFLFYFFFLYAFFAFFLQIISKIR